VLVRLFGDVPHRTGCPPKFAIPFRTSSPFSKIVLTLRHADGTHRGKVEVLGHGQQFVVHGVHPATQRPYVWTQGSRTGGAEILAAVSPPSLPELTPELILLPALQESLAAFNVTIEKSGTGRSPVAPVPDQASLRAPSLDELRAAVGAIPNPDDADRDDFVTMGLRHQGGCGPGE